MFLFGLALLLPFMGTSTGLSHGANLTPEIRIERVTGFETVYRSVRLPSETEIEMRKRFGLNPVSGGRVLLGLAALSLLLAPMFSAASLVVALLARKKRIAFAILTATGTIGSVSLAAYCVALSISLRDDGMREAVSVTPLVGFWIYATATATGLVAAAVCFWKSGAGSPRPGARWIGTGLAAGGICAFMLPVIAARPLANDRIARASDPNKTESGVTAKEILDALPKEDRRFFCVIDLNMPEMSYHPRDGFLYHTAKGSPIPWQSPLRSRACLKAALDAGLMKEVAPSRVECSLGYGSQCANWREFHRFASTVPGTKGMWRYSSPDGSLSNGGPAFPCYAAASVEILATSQKDGKAAGKPSGVVAPDPDAETIDVNVRYEADEVGRKVESGCAWSPADNPMNQPFAIVDGAGRDMGHNIGSIQRRVIVRDTGSKREVTFEPKQRLPLGIAKLSEMPGAVQISDAETAAAPSSTASAPEPSVDAMAAEGVPDAATGQGQDLPEGFPAEIPRTHSRPPNMREWNAAATVKLDPPGCFRKVVREWLKFNCSKGGGADPQPLGLTNLKQLGVENADYFPWFKEGQVVDVIVRMVSGKRAVATLELQGRNISLGYDWSSAGPYPKVVWE